MTAAPDRPPIDGPTGDAERLDVLVEQISDLAADRDRDTIVADDPERDRRALRDDDLRAGLREWGGLTFGTVDAFTLEVAGPLGLSFSHVRNALYMPRSRDVLDGAVALFRERTAEAAPSTADPS